MAASRSPKSRRGGSTRLWSHGGGAYSETGWMIQMKNTEVSIVGGIERADVHQLTVEFSGSRVQPSSGNECTVIVSSTTLPDGWKPGATGGRVPGRGGGGVPNGDGRLLPIEACPPDTSNKVAEPPGPSLRGGASGYLSIWSPPRGYGGDGSFTAPRRPGPELAGRSRLVGSHVAFAIRLTDVVGSRYRFAPTPIF